MTGQIHATVKSASSPARAFTPAPSGLLQRKCACGGARGVHGMCAECRRKRLTGEQHPLVQTKLTVNRPGDRYEQRAGGSSLSHTPETICREEPLSGAGPYEENGETVELATGGSSKCNLSGDAQTITNNNDECTRPCTQEHEENHVARRGPCCEQARTAYHAARDAGDSARQSRVMRLWNEWTRTNNAASECEAYQVSINCANRMYSDQSCDGSQSECCRQIVSYRTHVTERRDHYCGQSGNSTDRTPCPDFT